jgi:hypothetical protein
MQSYKKYSKAATRNPKQAQAFTYFNTQKMTICPKALLLESWGGRGGEENLKNGCGGGGEFGGNGVEGVSQFI